MGFEYIRIEGKPNAFRLKDLEVFFSDEKCLEVICNVLDEKGNIKNYPGVIEDKRWTEKQRVRLFSDVRYEARFHCIDNNRFLMLWLVQPNGWYWVDEDGFGFTGDSSIVLCSVVNSEGVFEKKFELFSIDGDKYCSDYDQYSEE